MASTKIPQNTPWTPPQTSQTPGVPVPPANPQTLPEIAIALEQAKARTAEAFAECERARSAMATFEAKLQTCQMEEKRLRDALHRAAADR